MRSRPHTEVAILGAGLTGMSAAYHLRERGVGCRVLEREDVPGGLAITLAEQGYRFDRTGHLLHLGDDAALADLALGWIGPEHRVLARQSAVWSHGVYTRYPFQANAYGLPPEVACECVMGFLEAADARAAGAPTPRNFAEYCRYHFGAGISRHFMLPYNERLWGVPPAEISVAWCERFVPRPTVAEVVAGAVGLVGPELGYNRRFVYPDHGIGQLSDGLAAALGPLVELGRRVVEIDGGARRLLLEGEEIGYGALVSTIALPDLVRLCRDAPAAVRQAASELRATALYYLDVALCAPCRKPYHWIYVPEARYPFYRVGSYSNLSAAMAPPGAGSLYVELCGRERPDLERSLPAIAAGLVELGLIERAADIRFARVRHIAHAYVIFDDRHERASAVVRAYLESVGIVSAGRYGGWNYSSMMDALAFGRSAAAQATAALEVRS